MFKKFPFQLLFVAVLSLAMFQNCKKKEDTPPANVITDTGGLKVTLTYTNGTPANDIDMFLYQNPYSASSVSVAGSNGTSSTESFELKPSSPLLSNGDYTLSAKYYEGATANNYTITFSGIAVPSRSYTINGTFAAGLAADNTYGSLRRNNIKLTKVTDTYTITP